MISVLKFFSFKTQNANSYHMLSKILFLNWFLLLSWILGVLNILLLYYFFPFTVFFYVFVSTIVFSSYLVGYLSCFSDKGEYPPAGIKWGLLNRFYFIVGNYLFSNLFPNNEFIISPDLINIHALLVSILGISSFC